MKPKYILTYKFHLYTITMEEKEVTDRFEYYEKFEDLLKDYRKKKESLFAGCINYNTDFKVFTLEYTEQDINKLDSFL